MAQHQPPPDAGGDALAPPFDRLRWHEDRVVLAGAEDVVFWIGRKRRSSGGTDDGFILDKSRRLIDQYEAFWRHRPMVEGPNVLELGIHDGASIAFWTELLQPGRYVGVDLASWEDSPYFAAWAAKPENSDRVRTRWNTDQADHDALGALCSLEFPAGLDMVIDDASHLLGPTRASFETLFPRLRPGGFYMIEDWSWGHWPNLPADFPLPREEEPTAFVANLVSAAGDLAGYASPRPAEPLGVPIASVTVQPDLVVVERGTAPLPARPLCQPQVPLVLASPARTLAQRRRWLNR